MPKFRTIKNIFILSFLGSLISSASIYWVNTCTTYSSFKECKVASFMSIPGRFFLNQLSNTKSISSTFFKTGKFILSGNIINPDETSQRFEKISPGFSFNYPSGSRPNAGYLLLSRANPSNRGSLHFRVYESYRAHGIWIRLKTI